MSLPQLIQEILRTRLARILLFTLVAWLVLAFLIIVFGKKLAAVVYAVGLALLFIYIIYRKLGRKWVPWQG